MRHFKYVLGLLVIAMASGCGGAPAPVAKKKPQVKKTATSQKKGTNSTSKPSASTGSEDKGTPFPIPKAVDEVPGDTPSANTDEKANQADLHLVQTDLGSGGLELFIDAPSGATVSKGSFYAEVVLREVFQVMICSQPENLESQLAEAKKPTAYDKFAGIELQDKDRLVLHLKDHFDGFSKYAVFVNKKIGKDTYCIKNDIALWKPKSKAELAVVLKSIDSLRPKQPVVEIAAEADRKLEPQNELFQKLPGRIAFNSFAFTHMAWSPDKNVLYSLGGDLLESWQFPEKKRLQAVERYPLDMIAMAPNGKWLVGASDEGEIEFRDPKSLEVVRKIDIKSKVNVLAVSPDSAVICFGQEDGIISLYSACDWRIRWHSQNLGLVKDESINT